MYEKVSSSLNNVAVTLYENNDKIQSKHFWATTLHIIKIDTLFFMSSAAQWTDEDKYFWVMQLCYIFTLVACSLLDTAHHSLHH